MTKSIRIENADTSAHQVYVEVWEKGQLISPATDNVSECREPDTLVKTHDITGPTQMVTETVWGTRYLVIKEVE